MPATLDKEKYSSYLHKLIITAIRQEDVDRYADGLEEGMKIRLITDIWTPAGQKRTPVNAWLHRKYKHFCTLRFFWNNGKEVLILERQVTYREMYICKRRNILPLADMRNKGLIEEVER